VESGFATFFSRTRNKLWMKGETVGSPAVGEGNRDGLRSRHGVAEVEALGPGVCHEGYASCFFASSTAAIG